MNYDVIVIGAGPAGNTAAIVLAENGRKVCLIEKSLDHIGGTCLNQGCIPVKSFLEAAEVCDVIKNSQSFGIEAEIKPLDLGKIKAITKNQLARLRKGIAFLYKKANVDLIEAGQVLDIPELDKTQIVQSSLQPSPAGNTESLGVGGGNSTIWGERIEGDKYNVKEGDWLSSISGRAYGDIFAFEKIAKANNIQNPNQIEVGSVLIIPR
ncbi:MAG: Dihydrolipoamide dehydrogenase [Candidatus Daviesbacteria bacterium GW2011_GWF2_38_7]|nr:MAG: Dihydrolipoamide dehydrogenase [Candidatus Daviesbacteria bacterium GW2011_GWF2_38_7]